MHKTSIILIQCINLTDDYYFIDTNDKNWNILSLWTSWIPSRWRWHSPAKRWYLNTSQYGIMLLKTKVLTTTTDWPVRLIFKISMLHTCLMTLVWWCRSIVDYCMQVDNGSRNRVNFVCCSVGWGTVVGKISSIKHPEW